MSVCGFLRFQTGQRTRSLICDGRTEKMGNLPCLWRQDPNKDPQGYGIDKLSSVLSKMPERNTN